MSRRIALFAGVLFLAAGCRSSTEGPREVWQKNLRGGNRADAPGYTLEEQRERGRERYTIPDDSRSVGPTTDMGRWDPTGAP